MTDMTPQPGSHRADHETINNQQGHGLSPHRHPSPGDRQAPAVVGSEVFAARPSQSWAAYQPYGSAYTGSPGYSPPVPYGPYVMQPPARTSSLKKRAIVGIGGAVLAAALVLGGVGIGRETSSTHSVASSTGSVASGNTSGTGSTGSTSGTGSTGSGSTNTGQGGFGGAFPGSTGSGATGQGTSDTSTNGPTATTAETAGIVTITSVLRYENAESAGTGMILTSNGEILTNNHVIDGATSVTVTVESTNRSYKATVVGTDPTDDIAVLQLKNASGLTVANLGDSTSTAVGDSVVGVGNAGGTGTLTAASGKITGVDKSITASDDDGANAEKLTGLLETDADIVAGDSGGPLYNSSGQIIGIDTAGSSTNSTATADGYAITIVKAVAIADKIESGTETSAIHIGLPAFVGVGVSSTSGEGATVGSVLSGGPAEKAGITAGSVITAVGGKTVTSAAQLEARLGTYQPGQQVTISWTAAGTKHTATLTLVSGPAD